MEGDFVLMEGDFDLMEGDFDLMEGDFDLMEGDFDLREGDFDFILGSLSTIISFFFSVFFLVTLFKLQYPYFFNVLRLLTSVAQISPFSVGKHSVCVFHLYSNGKMQGPSLILEFFSSFPRLFTLLPIIIHNVLIF